jgi:hypothetical protein
LYILMNVRIFLAIQSLSSDGETVWKLAAGIRYPGYIPAVNIQHGKFCQKRELIVSSNVTRVGVQWWVVAGVQWWVVAGGTWGLGTVKKRH